MTAGESLRRGDTYSGLGRTGASFCRSLAGGEDKSFAEKLRVENEEKERMICGLEKELSHREERMKSMHSLMDDLNS